MSFEVGVVAHFTARHHLVGDFGPASLPHEHAYRVDVTVGGDSLRDDGTLFDITHVQNALTAALAELDGHDLNTLPGFAELNPTAEVVAHYLWERMVLSLSNEGLDELRTRVWESAEAYASYSGELA